MTNLYNDLIKDIDYLKTSGVIYDLSKADIYSQLFATSKYDFKTRQVIKDIISILDIDNSLIKYITDDILKYFDDYDLNVFKKEGQNEIP